MQQDDVHACSQVQVLTTELIQVLENQLTNFSSSDWSKQKLLSSKPFQYTAAKLQIIQVLQLFFCWRKQVEHFQRPELLAWPTPLNLSVRSKKKRAAFMRPCSLASCIIWHRLLLSLFFSLRLLSVKDGYFSMKQVATFSALYCHDIVMHENLMAVHSYHFLVLLLSFF